MKKILVFGGSGFLGTYVVKDLLNRGYSVVICDLKQPNKSFDNILKNKNSKLIFEKCDLENLNDLNNVFSNYKFEYVFHFGGIADLDSAIKYPLKSFKINTLSTLNILDICVKKHIKKIIYASSAYATSIKGSFYGISKLTSEKLIEEYHKKYNLNYTILRYGSVYSEIDYKNNYIYNLIRSALKTGKIIHNGDGEEKREYIHAEDAAKLSVDIIESDSYDNQCFILTGIEQIKRSDLFKMIQEVSGKKIDIKLNPDGHTNHYKYTPYNFEPSIAKKIISNPQIDLGQGVFMCVKKAYENQIND